MILHFAPFLDSILIIKKHLNYCFIALTFAYVAKLCTLLELLYHYSPLNTNKGRFVGKLSKTKLGTAFLIKAWIKSYPLIALPCGIIVLIFTNSYLLYVIERDSDTATCY